MRLPTALLIATFLIPIAEPALSDSNSLWSTVDEQSLGDARDRNDYFLRVNSYIAGQYRIVKVDIDKLINCEPLVLDLFDGDVLKVKCNSVTRKANGSIIRWKGSAENPLVSVNELMSEVGDEADAQLMHDGLFGVQLTAGEYEVDPDSRANFAFYRTSDEDKRIGPDSFFGITARILVAHTGKRYLIRPLDFDGDYHMLSEIDPNKDAEYMEKLPPEIERSLSPEILERRKLIEKRLSDMRSYYDSLGTNPKLTAADQRSERLRSEGTK